MLLIVVCSCKSKNALKESKLVKVELIEKIENQLKSSPVLQDDFDFSKRSVFPRTLDESGDVGLVSKRDWTSGFYPGVLWYSYLLSEKPYWKEKATAFTELLESEQLNASNHDIGFKMMSSYGLAYKDTKNEDYKQVLIQSAKTLITRFDENIGCIRSWDHHKDKWEFPVIIDNLMNLELLYWAWKETGDAVYLNIANTHAKTTLKNHFRSDYSTYHVVNYDTITGVAKDKVTHQGYADNSCWARGEAWALYGYTMAYRETQDSEFLKQAEYVANYILNVAKLPNDFVPTWDFSLKDVAEEPKDASAAAVMASAFYELSTLTTNSENKKEYVSVADKMIASLSTDNYFNVPGTGHGFLLKHSTGAKPGGGEIDVPLVYADYYYLEALYRKKGILTTN
ncbi:MAG: glycoside hydrolase family 88 protein [Algibacter sp.]|uniref:glycoside hydrolase family 88 protein n=1 Tax=Algibacter sp. TaxID=1872428 RepID=UPI0032970857